MPATLIDRARRWSVDPVTVPAEPSASVIVLREEGARLETYLLHRHARMAFAASTVVFPGGRLDPLDLGATDPIRACACRETAEETSIELAADELWPWAHWITPEFEPRRYDTSFFVAFLPDGQQARDISGETDLAAWTAPVDALTAERSNEITLMPPTLSMLIELAEAGSSDHVRRLATGRVVEPVLPRLVETGAGWQFHYPQVR